MPYEQDETVSDDVLYLYAKELDELRRQMLASRASQFERNPLYAYRCASTSLRILNQLNFIPNEHNSAAIQDELAQQAQALRLHEFKSSK